MAHKVQVHYDTDRRTSLAITSYMHCGQCLETLPRGQSPQKWARQQLGVTAAGHLQLWCNRHDCNIAFLTLTCAEVEGKVEISAA